MRGSVPTGINEKTHRDLRIADRPPPARACPLAGCAGPGVSCEARVIEPYSRSRELHADLVNTDAVVKLHTTGLDEKQVEEPCFREIGEQMVAVPALCIGLSGRDVEVAFASRVEIV